MATTPTAQGQEPNPDTTVADLQRANAALRQQIDEHLAERDAALAREAALAEVLGVINRSQGDPAPVFQAILEKAMRLCGVAFGVLYTWDGKDQRMVAHLGLPPALVDSEALSLARRPGPLGSELIRTKHPQTQLDSREGEGYRAGYPGPRAFVDLGGARTVLLVPLLKDDRVLGYFHVFRQEIRAFSDKEIALLKNFAAQAVIAMENARLITEQREALEQQTATAEVLGVINASPGNLAPVFEVILEKAHRLCGAVIGSLVTWDGTYFNVVATHGFPDLVEAVVRQPIPPSARHQELIRGKRFVHVPDLRAVELRPDQLIVRAVLEHTDIRSLLLVPLRKDGSLLGFISAFRDGVHPFAEKEITLLESFAAQAVIAMENARLITEQREALEQQTATAEVLGVINASPGNLAPVFEAILEKAMHLCGVAFGSLNTWDGKLIRNVANRGVPPALAEWQEHNKVRKPGARALFAMQTRRYQHDLDTMAGDGYKSGQPGPRAVVNLGGARTSLFIPLVKDETVLGFFHLFRQEVRAFTEKEIALLESFAAQAVIAMENARLLGELQERTHDLQESLEYQTATSDVLKVISRSTFDLDPVFEAVVATAVRLCRADQAVIYRYQDGEYRWAAGYSLVPDYERIEREIRIRPGTGTLIGRVALEGRTVQILDAWTDPLYEAKEDARIGGVHTMLGVPLLRDGAPIGVIGLGRLRIEAYTERQIELVRTFAEQAVIAIGSVTAFQALQERTTELTRSVGELQALEEVLRAVNSSLDLDTVLATIISRAVQLSQADEGTIYEYDTGEGIFVPKSAFGMSEERVAALREQRIGIGETPLGISAATQAPLHVPDLTALHDIAGARELVSEGIHALLSVPLLRDGQVVGGLVIRRRTTGGFAPTIPTLLQTFAGQSVLAIENARLFQEAGRARAIAETTLADLRRTQDRLVQTEKMASLGQLTAGIAHEIKNPLNFVNNFSDLSVDLLAELNEAVAPEKLTLAADLRAEIDEITATLTSNLRKITEHGRRADSIVKNMLLHSRTGASERRAVNVNAVAEEALALAYHGARAESPGFNITLEKDFDPQAGAVEVFPQKLTRVLLNLIGNGFYAARKRAEQESGQNFEPVLRLTTRDLTEQVEIRVRDNGTGIPDAVREKIFDPFFTTKPAGEGTGLGLSLSFDIVVKQHGGQISVFSEPNHFTEFVVSLPRTALQDGARA